MTRFYLLMAVVLYAALTWMPCLELFGTDTHPDDRLYPLLTFHVEDYEIELEYIVMNSVVWNLEPEDVNQ